MLWIKFNVYSILLSLITLTILLVFCSCSFLYRTWWCYFIPLIALFIFLKAADIFEHFPQKEKLYHDLLAKAKLRYDQRYFVPYMGTACMRHVVFWTLSDLGKRNDYHRIKQRYKRFLQENIERQSAVIPSGPPKIVDVIMDQHEIKFVTRTSEK